MSARDRGLLDAAGMSIAETAVLLDRSRQAIYTGLSNTRDYFSAEEAMAILHDAKRRDSTLITRLVQFIGDNYPEQQSELILLDRVSLELMAKVIGEAERVIIAFNGNTDNLAPTGTFAVVLGDAINAGKLMLFIAPADWAVGYVEQSLGLTVSSHAISDEITYLPSFVVAERKGVPRAFFFMRLAAEEMHPTEAARLWDHLASKYLESGTNRQSEVA